MNYQKRRQHSHGFSRSALINALNQPGFDSWTPSIDVKHLERPRVRPAELPGDGRFAGVLLLTYADSDETRLVLTRRRDDLSRHPGQISFPGGRQDPGESTEETALRETQEEVGVASQTIQVLGSMKPVYIPPSDFTVHPYVGWHEGPPDFVREEAEVAEIITASLAQLADPQTLRWGDVVVAGNALRVPYFQVGSHRVWGATALIICELVERLRKLNG